MYCRIEAATTVTVPDLQNLLAAWKTHGPHLVGAFKCDEPLSEAQLRELPPGLREKFVPSEGDSVAWLEGLYALEGETAEA